MDARFRARIEALEPLLDQLREMTPVRRDALPRTWAAPGVYVFYERGKALYVGRAKNVRRRVALHVRPSSGHQSASFAFLIARRETQRLRAAYRTEGSRAALMNDRQFRKQFEAAKARIGRMKLRCVATDDSTTQALLEMYAAVALAAPYNDFDTH